MCIRDRLYADPRRLYSFTLEPGALQALTDRGYTYEKDGALWLKTSDILAAQLRQEGKSDEAIEKLGLKDLSLIHI